MINLNQTQRSLAESDACDEIRKGHDAAVIDILGPPSLTRSQYESQFVARLCESTGKVANNWRRMLSGSHPQRTVSIASVFTHQTPYVRWGTGSQMKRCELADLLVAAIDRSTGAQYGHAILIQAKQSDTLSTTLSTASEKKQYDLLSNRPIFDVEGNPAPIGVDLAALSPDDSLQYGLNPPASTISSSNNPTWSNDRWTMADCLKSNQTPYVINTHDCLATWLVELIEGKRGWRFDLPPKNDWQDFSVMTPRDSWSELINYLLEETFSKNLKQLAFGGTPPTRGREDALYFSAPGPSSNTMFATINRDPREDSLSNLSEDQNSDGPWKQVDSPPWGELNAGDGFDGTVLDAGDGESGPISAIVVEFGGED